MPSKGDSQGVGRRLLTVREAAQLLGISTASVRRLISSRQLAPVRLNRRLLLDINDLGRLVEQAKDRAKW